jgi:hypothetical protein
MGSATAPVLQLKENGWDIISSLKPTRTPSTYQNYIQHSKGEWSISKHGYVISNSGWFSERSTCYLASGKPVVVQDTGFSENIATGKGLFSFKDEEECVEAIKKANYDYKFHCTEARKIAGQVFNSSAILIELLRAI